MLRIRRQHFLAPFRGVVLFLIFSFTGRWGSNVLHILYCSNAHLAMSWDEQSRMNLVKNSPVSSITRLRQRILESSDTSRFVFSRSCTLIHLLYHVFLVDACKC